MHHNTSTSIFFGGKCNRVTLTCNLKQKNTDIDSVVTIMWSVCKTSYGIVGVVFGEDLVSNMFYSASYLTLFRVYMLHITLGRGSHR